MMRNRSQIVPYVTKDGSSIRELFHPDSSPVAGFSLAEALVGPGETTKPHRHRESQEIYYVLEGRGTMRLGDKTFGVAAGDAILILPGTLHDIKSDDEGALRILCICHPPYSHEDTAVGP